MPIQIETPKSDPNVASSIRLKLFIVVWKASTNEELVFEAILWKLLETTLAQHTWWNKLKEKIIHSCLKYEHENTT